MKARLSLRGAAARKNWLFKKVIKKESVTLDEPPAETAKLCRIIKSIDIDTSSKSGIGSVAQKISLKRLLKKNNIQFVGNNSFPQPIETSVPAMDPNDINIKVAEKTRELEEKYKLEKEQAYKDGYNKGKTDGFTEGASSLGEIENFLDAINKEVILSKEYLLKNAEEIMAKLSLEIAEAVIGEAAMKSSNELLGYNLERCLGILGGSGKVLIRVSPNDYEFAKDKIEVLFSKKRDKFNFEFEPDSNITPGGCYIESSGGAIDGRIENQFDLVKENFLQMI